MNKAQRAARAAAARAAFDEVTGETDGQQDGSVRQLSANRASPPPKQRARKASAAGSKDSGPAAAFAAATAAPEPPPPFRTKLTPKLWTSPPGRGDLVFYKGERMFVEPPVPKDLLECPWIRIGDHRVPKVNPATGEWPRLNDKRTSFAVHVDELSAVPPEFNKLSARLPTVASVARAGRAKVGIRDVGDTIATMLRDCDTLDAVYDCAASYLAIPVEDLRKKYGHLNPGQQRMNLGNKMRFKWKKENT